MRKLLLCAVIAILGIAKIDGQEKGKIRVGLDLGYASAKGGGGVLVVLEPKYNLTDNSSVGLRLGSAAFGRAVEIDGESLDLDISTNANYLVTYDYYFNNGNSSVAPFLGTGLGVYSLASVSANENSILGIASKSEFGGMIRGGVELGKFRLGLEYNIIPKTDLESGGNVKNSYLGFSLGFYVGGGKWKK